VAPIMTEMAIVLGMVRFRHQYFDVLANHLLRRIAEQALSSGIDRFNVTVLVDGNDSRSTRESGIKPRPAWPLSPSVCSPLSMLPYAASQGCL
jgi:hypothetical protein